MLHCVCAASLNPLSASSKRGHDRCRHFVITQNHGGQFVISGDCQAYGSLSELIEHYKFSPIQPFGEYLTSSCNQVSTAHEQHHTGMDQRTYL